MQKEGYCPFVSVIIPCRNEERFIGKCLDSILDQDYPKDKLEILVMDGMSSDGTQEIIKKYTNQYPFIRLLYNVKKTTPAALNTGIRKAFGDVIIRMDAHNIYDKKYVSNCVTYLKKHKVDNVGGIWITMPGSDTLLAKSISLALSHPFGIGNAYFRTGLKEPKFVDTVPFGCYNREVFQKIGLFDEDLIRNQDDEFNLRLIRNGGRILLVPDIISFYYARDSILKLWRMYFQYGYFKPLVAKKVGAVLTWRQIIPLIFVSNLIIFGIFALVSGPSRWLFLFFLSTYLLASAGFSLSIALKKGFKYLFTLPLVFGTLHFSYGSGYLKGILDFIIFQKHKREKNEDISLTR